ncbi:nitroreductase family deazaflavin-dependent oxidoreductase [Carbonactinospora thermoautotrophica]|uniref:nitroreductase/quinone reductase family protein n=1 Tax=Carbonactinospora thermoautotrophica TaxID=1469144 RepID=UPI00226DC69A|nr:nitroreductase/quinone reductase family protein [Carbonactinospora thermoautotrophica]MCX9193548.1 nitroreductase family deazaflavin-dependent oxidoreductase [Carbonactinospora thermoautotrophica]
MARYIAPGRLVRAVVNPLVMRFGAATTLVVRARVTGKTQAVPVNVLDYEGGRYLVAVRGETQWVRNLRAAGECELRRRGQVYRYVAEEVPVEDREPVIAAYRERWDSQVRRFFQALPDPADHPVFRLRQA